MKPVKVPLVPEKINSHEASARELYSSEHVDMVMVETFQVLVGKTPRPSQPSRVCDMRSSHAD